MGEGSTKREVTETLGDLWKGDRWGQGTQGKTGWLLQRLSERKAGNLKEEGLGWINEGRKDHGFGWGKI